MALLGPSPEEIAAARRTILREALLRGGSLDLREDAPSAYTKAAAALVDEGRVERVGRTLSLPATRSDAEEDTRRVAHIVMYWIESLGDTPLTLDRARSSMANLYRSSEINAGITYLRDSKLILITHGGVIHDNTGTALRAKSKRAPAPNRSVIRDKREAEDARLRANYNRLINLTTPGWFAHDSDKRLTTEALAAVQAETWDALTHLPGGRTMKLDRYRATLEAMYPDHGKYVEERLVAAGFIRVITKDGIEYAHVPDALPETSFADVLKERREREEEQRRRKEAEKAERARIRRLRFCVRAAASRWKGIGDDGTYAEPLGELIRAGLLVMEGDLYFYVNPVIDATLTDDERARAREVTAHYISRLIGEETDAQQVDDDLALRRLRDVLVDGDGNLIKTGSVIDALPVVEKRLEAERRAEQERLERERLEQERLERERLEQERLERERLEQEKKRRAAREAAKKAQSAPTTAPAAAKAPTQQPAPSAAPAPETTAPAAPVAVGTVSTDDIFRGLSVLNGKIEAIGQAVARAGGSPQAMALNNAPRDVRVVLEKLVGLLSLEEGRTLPESRLKKGIPNRPLNGGAVKQRALFEQAVTLGEAADMIRLMTGSRVFLLSHRPLLTDEQLAARQRVIRNRRGVYENADADELAAIRAKQRAATKRQRAAQRAAALSGASA